MSVNVNCSFKNIHAITAEVGGTKKNKVVVLPTVPLLIKNIRIVKAPNETNIIW